MLDKLEIIPGTGIGNIKFGISREELKAILGEPDEVDKFSYSDDENDLTESWHYDENEISFSFDEEDGWKLGIISISSEDVILSEQKLIGIKKDDLLKKLEELKIGELESEDCSSSENPEHFLISSLEKEINFWLEEGELSEIQFGPFISDEDEVIWP